MIPDSQADCKEDHPAVEQGTCISLPHAVQMAPSITHNSFTLVIIFKVMGGGWGGVGSIEE